ncbi:MAG TPA: hypothetical protein VH020_06725 [Stellaceae bacterium]|jgi:hypothetical protein|nr:hypothetical protein [Stellaceae bacterium]
MASVAAFALTRTDADPSLDSGVSLLYRQCHGGMVGLGFGFSPWWGPYDSYAPPAYSYPPPVYSVPPPPPPRAPARSQLGACQEFESTVIVDGQSRIAKGLACPEADGSWRIVR